MKYQVLFSLKNNEIVFMDVVCCCRDWCLKGLLHCFSTDIEITRNNWFSFILKNVENCKEKFQRVRKL